MIDDASPGASGRVATPGPGSVAAGPAFLVSAVGVVLVALCMRQAVAGIPPILGDLGLTPDQQSLLVSIPVLCFSIGALAGPAARARLGEERAVFAMVATLAAGLVIRAVWPEWGLFPGTILAGLSIAMLNVLLSSLVKRRFPQRVGPMTASYTSAMTIGAALAAGLTVPVLRASGSTNVALGIWAVPALLALLVWLPQLQFGAPAAQATATIRRQAIWRYPLAWCVMLFMGMQSLLFYGSLSWLPEIYRDRGLDAAAAGFLLLLFNVCGIVGNLAAPVLASRRADQRGAVAAALTLYLVSLIGVLLAPTATAPLWALLLGTAQGASLSLALLIIVLRSADSEAAARLSSMAQSGGYLLAATGPLVMGLLHAATNDWTAPLLFLIAVAVLIWVPGLIAARNLTVGSRPADQQAS
jgi:CP family cyanate transporter-like MFS transporter